MPLGTFAPRWVTRFADTMPAETEAVICGKFAVHTPSGDPLKSWPSDAWFAISHVQTGMRVADIYGRRNASTLARMLNDALPGFDLELADTEDMSSDRYRQFLCAARFTIDHFAKEHPSALLSTGKKS